MRPGRLQRTQVLLEYRRCAAGPQERATIRPRHDLSCAGWHRLGHRAPLSRCSSESPFTGAARHRRWASRLRRSRLNRFCPRHPGHRCPRWRIRDRACPMASSVAARRALSGALWGWSSPRPSLVRTGAGFPGRSSSPGCRLDGGADWLVSDAPSVGHVATRLCEPLSRCLGYGSRPGARGRRGASDDRSDHVDRRRSGLARTQ